MSNQASVSNTIFGFQAMMIGSSQKITTSGTSQQASSFAAKTSILRLFSTTDCYIAVGDNPTASSSSLFLPGGIVEYFGISSGQKLAAIQSSGAGVLYISEGA